MSPYQFTNVLVAIDGSDDTEKALDCALSICSALDAQLTVLGSRESSPPTPPRAARSTKSNAKRTSSSPASSANAQQTAADRGVSTRTDLVPGHSADVIVHYAAAHAHDLIVVAHHAHILGDMLIGSTADRVAHHAHCPVLVVR